MWVSLILKYNLWNLNTKILILKWSDPPIPRVVTPDALNEFPNEPNITPILMQVKLLIM